MPLISNGTSEQLPPWVTQPQKKKQASEVPWRKNLRSTGGPPSAPAPASTAPSPKTNAKVATPSAPTPKANAKTAATPAPAAVEPQPPKTTKLQINLKSVKKPDTPTQPSQTDKLPPVQLNPVLPETKQTTNKPPTGKSIPITILKTVGDSPPAPAPVKPPSMNTTTIPIQRPHSNEQPPPLPAPTPANKKQVKTPEGKVKATKEGKSKASASPLPPESSKMAPPPPPPAPPAPPPPPGAPPPPPPPPGGMNAGLPPKAPKPPQVVQKIEQLKKAPRKRPDWANMMKEIETGRKLKHVQCNDRSKPILPRTKSRGKFMFESEVKPASKTDALHNKLLNEIQSGIKLKKVQCNDRSKPQLSGLRFRRQSSVADSDVAKVSDAIPEPEELAFVMDIDVLRDELQSAKQMLEMEIDSKHNIEKKNRDQKCQIIAMEAEIDTLKAKLGLIPEDEVSMISKGLDKSDSRTFKHLRKSGSGLWKSPSIAGIKKSKSGITKELQMKPMSAQQPGQGDHAGQQEEDLNEVNELEEEITSLKQSVQHARKQAEEMERKFKETMEKLLVAQGTLEDSEQKRRMLEKKVDTMQKQQSGKMPLTPSVQTAERTTQTEEQILDRMLSRTQSSATQNGGTGNDGGLFTDSEEEDSDMEVDEETLQRKKDEREIKLWENKYKSIKDKQHASRLERKNLKILQKKLEAELKEAKKRHKKLQKEVDKMAKMLKEVEKAEGEDEDGEGDEEEKEEEPEETEEEEESEEEETEEEESESEEEDDDDEESSEEDDDEAGHEDRLSLYGKRVKRRENVLNALRKGNYLLRANIDRLKDDLEEARISYHDLEHELSSVLDDM